jgi:hypothetical protein
MTLPHVKVGSVLRAADGRRYKVTRIRKQAADPLDDEEALIHQRVARRRRKPRLNSGLSYARPRVDEPPFPEGA